MKECDIFRGQDILWQYVLPSYTFSGGQDPNPSQDYAPVSFNRFLKNSARFSSRFQPELLSSIP